MEVRDSSWKTLEQIRGWVGSTRVGWRGLSGTDFPWPPAHAPSGPFSWRKVLTVPTIRQTPPPHACACCWNSLKWTLHREPPSHPRDLSFLREAPWVARPTPSLLHLSTDFLPERFSHSTSHDYLVYLLLFYPKFQHLPYSLLCPCFQNSTWPNLKMIYLIHATCIWVISQEK